MLVGYPDEEINIISSLSPTENDEVIIELADIQVLVVVRTILEPVTIVPIPFFLALTDAVEDVPPTI